SPAGADGLTFTMQNMGNNVLGFGAQLSSLTHVNVFFNTYLNWINCTDYRVCDYSDNSVGIVVNQNYLVQPDLHPLAINLKDSQVHTAHVKYERFYMNVRVDNALVLTNVVIPLPVATDNCGMAWVGFTGLSGASWENQDVLNWTFCENAPTFGADMFIP